MTVNPSVFSTFLLVNIPNKLPEEFSENVVLHASLHLSTERNQALHPLTKQPSRKLSIDAPSIPSELKSFIQINIGDILLLLREFPQS